MTITDPLTGAARHAQEIADRPERAGKDFLQTSITNARDAMGTNTTPAAAPVALPGASTGETVASGTLAISQILQTIGIDPTTANAQASTLLAALDTSGLDPTSATDSSSVQAFVDTWLPQQQFFQQRFPGIVQQLAAGQNPISAVDYINLEDTMDGLATQYGLNPNVVASPSAIAAMVVGNVSASEMSSRFNTYMDAYESEAPEVQQAFNQFYGINGPTAYAAAIANPTITDDELKQQMAVASIAGAGATLGVNVTQSAATQLAQLGVSYQSALSAAASTTKEAGLYTTSVGEQSQQSGPGAMQGVTQGELFASNAKVASAAAGGIAANNDAAIQQEIENRENAFKGGGGAATTEAEGYEGLGTAHAS